MAAACRPPTHSAHRYDTYSRTRRASDRQRRRRARTRYAVAGPDTACSSRLRSHFPCARARPALSGRQLGPRPRRSNARAPGVFTEPRVVAGRGRAIIAGAPLSESRGAQRCGPVDGRGRAPSGAAPTARRNHITIEKSCYVIARSGVRMKFVPSAKAEVRRHRRQIIHMYNTR
eukprot:1469905-Prymnesium_polylepis.1